MFAQLFRREKSCATLWPMELVTIDIHQAHASEAAEVADVHLASWQAAYRGIIPHTVLEQMIARRGDSWWQKAINRGTHVIVINFNGLIVGYATVGLNRARTLAYDGEIYELYLLPEYQGIGLGRQLFENAQKVLSHYGLKSNVLWVLEENEQACLFYERMGGRMVKRASEIFGDKCLQKRAYAWGA